MSGNDYFSELAELARALGHPHRLKLLELTAKGEHAVELLAAGSGLTVANASQHLQLLKRAGLLQSRRDGKHVLYSLGGGPVSDVLSAMRSFVEHQRSVVRDLLAASAGAPPPQAAGIALEELLRRLREDSITLVDVRPRKEFNAGHLPGAMSVPLEELDKRLSELPRGREVVAYCRGPYCVLSTEAVALLNARGLRARRLGLGFPEWEAAGLQIEKRARSERRVGGAR
jgi:rhodanese-related sulfurtransferase